MSKSKKQEAEKAKLEALEKALENAPCVDNHVDLLTEVKKRVPAIISTEEKLYASFLKKFPREKIAKKSKATGSVLIALGAFITISSSGLLSGIGVPMALTGAAAGVAGKSLEEYKHYSIFMDYDNKRVIFLKTKGRNALDLPEDFSV